MQHFLLQNKRDVNLGAETLCPMYVSCTTLCDLSLLLFPFIFLFFIPSAVFVAAAFLCEEFESVNREKEWWRWLPRNNCSIILDYYRVLWSYLSYLRGIPFGFNSRFSFQSSSLLWCTQRSTNYHQHNILSHMIIT